MSDEHTPLPSLRLKPRLQPADAPISTVAPSTAAHPPPTPRQLPTPEILPDASAGDVSSRAAASSELPKFRLKPRLMTDASATTSSDSALIPPPEPPPATATARPSAEILPDLRTIPAAGAPLPIRLQPRQVSAATPPPQTATTVVPPPYAQNSAPVSPLTPSETKPTFGAPLFRESSPVHVPPLHEPLAASTQVPAPPLWGNFVPAALKTVPPPFPVVALPGTVKSPPPLPLTGAPVMRLADEPSARLGSKSPLIMVLGGIAALGLLGGGYFAWQKFISAPPAPLPLAATQKSVPSAPVAKVADPSPSDLMNKIAHAPAAAIGKARSVVAARASSGQSDIESVLAPQPPKQPAPSGLPPAAQVPAGANPGSTGVASVSPGLSATTVVDAAPDAVPAFRSFVANVKVSGLAGGRAGRPPVAIINGRLTRAGDVVDAGLGIIFDTIDAEKKQVIFRDKSGATVARRY